MTTERCTSGPRWISESELGAKECLHVAERGERRSGKDSASPISMSEGGETILAAGRDKDSGWVESERDFAEGR